MTTPKPTTSIEARARVVGRAKELLASDDKYDAMVLAANGLELPAQLMADFAQAERLSAVREAFAEVRKRAMTDDGNEYRIGGISAAMTAVLKEMQTK